MSFLRDFFLGSPEKHERVSTLSKNQQQVLQNLISALGGQGAGGAFGSSADYFYNILNDNPELMQQFFAPEMRRFQQETIPSLGEQFAGMGAGGLTSSGFRNAAVNAGADLQERLAQIRSNLKQGAAQGLAGLGQMGLGNYSQDVMTQPGSQGFLPEIAGGIGGAVAGPLGSLLGSGISKLSTSSFGKSSPYGNQRF